MIETGISKLDEYLGGIPEGKSVIFQIEPGVEESNIAIHVLYHNLKKGLNGIYIASESSPKNVEKIFREFGWEIKNFNNLYIIDGYSSLIGAPSEEKFVVEEPHDIRSYEDAIIEIMEKVGGGGILVFDSLSNVMDMCGERETLEGIERINKDVAKEGYTSIYNFISWPYKEAILYRLRRLFNAIIEVRTVEDVVARQRMEIKKADWCQAEGKKLEFKIFKPEGIRIYIPKISVIGPYQAGKTTFIKSISRNFTPVERLGATVGVEHGTVDYKQYRAEIFGIPGQERFLPLLDKLGSSSKGVFLVIDSTKPHEFELAKNMLAKFGDIPYVIVANKQDLPGALRKDELKNKMGLPEAEIVETVASQGKGVYEAFEKLVEKILECLNAS
ncbi:MAG TPA: GTP-binding protein [Thermoplasmatales archaeon]|nr:GTP-binding protein [Thermoplasmatales archaeon]